MARQKYHINGRDMLMIDHQGLVDYDEYYILLGKSAERRADITTEYQVRQNESIIEGEPSINYSVYYAKFLDELKNRNIKMYNQKLRLLKNYLADLKEEENIHLDAVASLLEEGYAFDSDLRKKGIYIINVDGAYFQYEKVSEGKIKVEMGESYFAQNANISSFQLVPIAVEEYQRLKEKQSVGRKI